MSGVDLNFKVEVGEVPCPFCTGKFDVGEFVEDAVPGVVHTTPPCEKFVDLGVTEFLRAVNEHVREHGGKW